MALRKIYSGVSERVRPNVRCSNSKNVRFCFDINAVEKDKLSKKKKRRRQRHQGHPDVFLRRLGFILGSWLMQIF